MSDREPVTDQPVTDGGQGRPGWPLALLAAVLVGVAAVFFLWRHDAEQSDGRDRPVTLGVEQDVDGLALLDVALVTAPRDELALLATLTVRSGPEDRVTEVRVGGVRARLDGGADAWRVTTALLDVRPDGAGLRAVAPYRAAAGTLVPVTVVLATRGETTFQVPVWSSDTWPDGA